MIINNESTAVHDIFLGKEEGFVFTKQYANKVTYYTSQYGNESGVSYTANNLVGPPSRFPAYGDFSETYVPVYFDFTYFLSLILLSYLSIREPMDRSGKNLHVPHQLFHLVKNNLILDKILLVTFFF